MERISIAPRPDYQAKVSELGLTWHTPDGVPYWDESAYWRLAAGEVEVLERATEDLYQMVLAAVGRVIEGPEVETLGYSDRAVALIRDSWARGDALPHIYGRFDLAYLGGDSQPKLLEFNADTPTSMLECGVIQWFWLRERFPKADQFNSLHEKLVQRLRDLAPSLNMRAARNGAAALNVTCVTPHAEDEGTVAYLESCAREAGLFSVQFVPLEQIGWTTQQLAGRPTDAFFSDLEERRIANLFKLAPWEWMLDDDFGDRLIDEVMSDRLWVMEPAWKMVAAHKRLLATLWEMYPGHPNLLPAFSDQENFRGKPHVAKPVWGREGQNVILYDAGGNRIEENDGDCGGNEYVYQAQAELAAAGGNHAILGSWVVDGYAAGVGFRESTSLITNNLGRFVPHLFEP
jgi:glutathionylspermidine synthase